MIVEWLGGGRKELDYKYILKVEPIVFAHGLDVSFEREELRPELLVKKMCYLLLRWERLGKRVFGHMGRKYQVFTFVHVIVYMAIGDLNEDVK